jgi:4-hydroxythreonine-4-phosphate dehydrogenase
MKRLAITTGDNDGIGFEISAKALHQLGPQKGVQFYLFRSQKSEVRYLNLIDKKFKRISVFSLEEALQIDVSSSKIIFDICTDDTAPKNVEVAARACTKKHLDGLITAPLSKTLIQACGYKAKGHTEILQKISNVKTVHMVFIGRYFNVLLATGHLSLDRVSRALNKKTLSTALTHAELLRKYLAPSKRKRPIALLGLNPHAGEAGVLGGQEKRLFSQVLPLFPNVEGPLVPDAAFLQKNWARYCLYVCCYHDQGLIPFKLVHGTKSGYHLTFGLPFIRTSVDHGTAKDIFGKNKADFSSMKEAIQACIQLAK